MLSLLLLASAVVLPTGGGVPTGPLTPPSRADIVGVVPLAERARGTKVADALGTPLGIVDQSDANFVILLVGGHKLQVPANALRRIGTQIALPLTSQQIEQQLATEAAFQEQLHPSPQPVQPPKGFKPIPAIAPTTTEGVAARAAARAASLKP